MPVLDTNFLIALEDGNPAALALLTDISSEELVVPAVVAAEYLTHSGARRSRALEELERAFTIRNTSRTWIETAAAHRSSLAQQGVRFRLPDFWIGIWALAEKTYVVTQNENDFRALKVKTRSW